MNWAVWDDVETSLREHHIKPIVAVVPDNRDPSLKQIRAGLEIFRSRHVAPDVGIAPGHSFDERRHGVLTQLGLRRISDGFFFSIPGRSSIRVAPYGSQQLWRLKRRGRGLWTVCYHINRWTYADVAGSVATWPVSRHSLSVL